MHSIPCNAHNTRILLFLPCFTFVFCVAPKRCGFLVEKKSQVWTCVFFSWLQLLQHHLVLCFPSLRCSPVVTEKVIFSSSSQDFHYKIFATFYKTCSLGSITESKNPIFGSGNLRPEEDDLKSLTAWLEYGDLIIDFDPDCSPNPWFFCFPLFIPSKSNKKCETFYWY